MGSRRPRMISPHLHPVLSSLSSGWKSNFPSRIEGGKFRPQGVAAVGDGAQPTPHIVLPGKGLGHDLPRHGVPLGRYRPGVLVLQVGVAVWIWRSS